MLFGAFKEYKLLPFQWNYMGALCTGKGLVFRGVKEIDYVRLFPYMSPGNHITRTWNMKLKLGLHGFHVGVYRGMLVGQVQVVFILVLSFCSCSCSSTSCMIL